MAPTLTANQESDVFTGEESTTYTMTWSGNVSASYDYLLHAAPSFNDSSSVLTLNLDFGTFHVGDVATLGFDLFNLADVNRAGLDLDSITGKRRRRRFDNKPRFLRLARSGHTHRLAGHARHFHGGCFPCKLPIKNV